MIVMALGPAALFVGVVVGLILGRVMHDRSCKDCPAVLPDDDLEGEL